MILVYYQIIKKTKNRKIQSISIVLYDVLFYGYSGGWSVIIWKKKKLQWVKGLAKYFNLDFAKHSASADLMKISNFIIITKNI